MATASNPALPPDTRQLTAEEGWNLIFSLFGSAKDLYAEYGGGEAWLKAERAAWADEPDRQVRSYLDSMVWIYAFEGNPHFGAAAQNLLRKLRASGHTVLVSHFLLGELLVVPIRSGDSFLVAS